MGISDASYFDGMGPDAPVKVETNGAMQSALPYRFDLIPAEAMFAVAAVFAYGATKYAVDNWKGLELRSVLNHVLSHIYAYLGGDTSDDHLEHAACRMMMALYLKEHEE